MKLIQTTPALLESPFEDDQYFDQPENSRRALTKVDLDDNHMAGAIKRSGLFSKNQEKPFHIQKDPEEISVRPSFFFSSKHLEKDSVKMETMEIELSKKKNEEEVVIARKKVDSATKTLKNKKLWKRKGFYIIFLIMKFISIMKLKVISLRIWEVKPPQLNIVGDSIFFPDKSGKLHMNFQVEKFKRNMILIARERYRANHSTFKRQIYRDKWQETMKKLKSLFFIFLKLCYTALNFIKPNTKTRVFWDLLSIVITAGQLWYIPLISSFPNLDSDSFWVFFERIPLMTFTFDILFNFITGYYSKGSWVEDKTKVAIHYLKKEFWIDLVTLIPIYIVYTFKEVDRMWALIFMVRLIRMKKMFERTQDHFQLKKLDHLSILSLLTLGLKVFYSAHIGACIWHYLSISQENEINWLVYYKLDDQPWFVQYINGFYFIIVTMVTVGYGDLSPQTTLEKGFICFLVLIGCGQFGYCLNKIGSVFQQIFENETKLLEEIAAINNYMIQKNVPKVIQIKVRRYLEYIDQQDREGYQKGVAILNTLSKSLKDEVLSAVFAKDLEYFDFLTKNFSDKFLTELTFKMSEISYAPEQPIFKENEDNEKNLYMIIKGQIELIFEIPNSHRVFKTLSPHSSFGEFAFITGNPHTFTARSKDCSSLVQINREEFLELLDKFPEDKERFIMIRDSLLFYNDFELSNLKCESCGKANHLIRQCPFVTYSPDKDFIIKREINSQPQRRKAHIRRDKRSLNSLIIKNDLEELVHLKMKAEKNEKITVFLEQTSFGDTLPMEETLSNLNLEIPLNVSQKRGSNFSLPSQVGILKHYRQSRDFQIKRGVSFLVPKTFEKPIKEEIGIEEDQQELKINKHMSSSNSENNDSHNLKNFNFNNNPNSSPRNQNLINNNNNIEDSLSSSTSEEEEKTSKKEKNSKKTTKSWEFDEDINEKESSVTMISLPITGDNKNKQELRFDKIKSFRFYFPYNNLEEIVKEMEKIKKRKIKQRQFYFKKAIMMNKISKMIANQKRRSRVGVKNKMLGKTFNFFRTIQRKLTTATTQKTLKQESEALDNMDQSHKSNNI